jgi:hypothetical protein
MGEVTAFELKHYRLYGFADPGLAERLAVPAPFLIAACTGMFCW